MAGLIFTITTPVDGAVVGRNIVVQGRTRVVAPTRFPAISLEGFGVTFSDGGVVQPAGFAFGEWRWEGSPAPTSTGGTAK